MGSADTHVTDWLALPPRYSARAATLDDAHAVAQLRTVYQADEGNPPVITAEEQRNDWQGTNLAEDTGAQAGAQA